MSLIDADMVLCSLQVITDQTYKSAEVFYSARMLLRIKGSIKEAERYRYCYAKVQCYMRCCM
jgi:hypothetical protein